MHSSQTGFRICVSFIALMGILLISGLVASEKIQVGYRDFTYPSKTGQNSRPTGEKPESKLWYNDGSWWGILWSTAGKAYRIHRLDLTTQDWLDTGTAVDARRDSRSDVGWDGAHLYVASHIFATKATRDADCFAGLDNSNCGKLFRFSYNAGTKTYTLDSGLPKTGANVRSGKTETLVLAKDTTGRLWVTYVEDNQVIVNYSLNDGLTWATPFALPGASLDAISGSTFTDDIATIIAYEGHVGIMWSHQRENNLSQPTNDPNPHSGGSDCAPDPTVPTCKGSRTASDTDNVVSPNINFAVHEDGADPSAWTFDTIYTASGDDHINVKAAAGYLFATYKEEGLAKQVGLLVCQITASACRNKPDWKHYPVFKRFDNSGNSPQADLAAANSANPTRPIALVDTDHRDLYIFASVEQGLAKQSSIRYKKTSIDRINFPDDDGVPFITTDVLNNDPTSVINDPTTTKQNVNSTTGLVVLASDAGPLRYFHNYLSLK
jgi:hypothetical protein